MGPCANESRYRLDIEVKSCPAVEEPDRVVFRLPHGCISRDICRDPMWSLRWGSSSRPTGEMTQGPQWVILEQCCLEVAEPLAEPNDCNNIMVNIGHKNLNDIDIIIKQKL